MEDDEKKSSRSGGALLILLLVLLFYVLSVGPAAKWALSHSFRTGPPISKFYAPVIWLGKHTPLRKPLSAYVDWWISL